MSTKFDASFGIVPLKKQSGRWEVLLIQHQKARYWGFPKGHPDPDESPRDTAERELKEETNLDVIRYLRSEPFSEQYSFSHEGKKVVKTVVYFVAEVMGELKLQKKEILSGIWVPFPDAIAKATHKEGKEILQQVEKILPLD